MHSNIEKTYSEKKFSSEEHEKRCEGKKKKQQKKLEQDFKKSVQEKMGWVMVNFIPFLLKYIILALQK